MLVYRDQYLFYHADGSNIYRADLDGKNQVRVLALSGVTNGFHDLFVSEAQERLEVSVPVAEPGGLGLVGLALLARRRKRAWLRRAA